LYGGEDSAARAVVTITSTGRVIGALVGPQRENRVVVVGPREALADPSDIRSHKLGIAVGAYVHAGVRLIVQREAERQADEGSAVVSVITDVSVTRHDRVGPLSYRVLAGRATFYSIAAVESRVRIAIRVADRPCGNVGRQVATERYVQRELGSHASVGHSDIRGAGASVTAQLEIGCGD
jgi:hypothetical protein